MKFNTYSISELIDEIAMGPFGSNIKVECFVDEGIPVLNGSNLNGFFLTEDSVCDCFSFSGQGELYMGLGSVASEMRIRVMNRDHRFYADDFHVFKLVSFLAIDCFFSSSFFRHLKLSTSRYFFASQKNTPGSICTISSLIITLRREKINRFFPFG